MHNLLNNPLKFWGTDFAVKKDFVILCKQFVIFVLNIVLFDEESMFTKAVVAD